MLIRFSCRCSVVIRPEERVVRGYGEEISIAITDSKGLTT